MSQQNRQQTDKPGPSVPRTDARAKCLGRAGYLDEADFPGLLFARTVRSTRPRARLVSIETPALPEGYFIVDKSDVPGRLRPYMFARDYPILADETVNYLGEAVCLVVGPDREVILDICRDIHIEYRDIPPVLTLDESLAASDPVLSGPDNVFVRREFERGQVDRAFRERVDFAVYVIV